MSDSAPETTNDNYDESGKTLREHLWDRALLEMNTGNTADAPIDDPRAIFMAAQHDLNMARYELSVWSYPIDTVAAILGAADYTGYRIESALTGSVHGEETTRDIALFWETLHAMGINPRHYANLLKNLRNVTEKSDLLSLVDEFPEYAHAMLNVVLRFSNGEGPIGLMPVEIRNAIQEQPSLAKELIEYSHRRNINRLNDLDSLFLDVTRGYIAPMRDGVL